MLENKLHTGHYTENYRDDIDFCLRFLMYVDESINIWIGYNKVHSIVARLKMSTLNKTTAMSEHIYNLRQFQFIISYTNTYANIAAQYICKCR